MDNFIVEQFFTLLNVFSISFLLSGVSIFLNLFNVNFFLKVMSIVQPMLKQVTNDCGDDKINDDDDSVWLTILYIHVFGMLQVIFIYDLRYNR